MDKFFSNLARQAEANPIGAMVAASMLMGSITKLIRVHHEGINARAWAKEVNRRDRKTVVK
jgi:hypothetical protein